MREGRQVGLEKRPQRMIESRGVGVRVKARSEELEIEMSDNRGWKCMLLH